MQIVQSLGLIRCLLTVRSRSLVGLGCLAALVWVVSPGAMSWAEQKTVNEVKVPDSFASCVVAGGRVQSEGSRCTMETGEVFERPIKAARAACKDLCGDGKCQEIVCMAVGCPCAESADTCPADCKK